MSKRSKIIIIGVSIVVVIAIILIAIGNNLGFFKTYEQDSYDKNIEILKDKYPTDILVYGEEVEFRSSLKIRKIDSLSDVAPGGSDYILLVINDRSGELEITDQEYEALLDLVENKVSLFYMGKSKLDTFEEKGFYTNLDPGQAGFAIWGENGQSAVGYWSKAEEDVFAKNPEIMGSQICQFMVDMIRGVY